MSVPVHNPPAYIHNMHPISLYFSIKIYLDKNELENLKQPQKHQITTNEIKQERVRRRTFVVNCSPAYSRLTDI